MDPTAQENPRFCIILTVYTWQEAAKSSFLGKEVTKKNLEEIRQKVGLVFQDPDDQLFARTVSQDVAFGPTNLGLPKQEIEERVKWALEVTEMQGLENKAPQNLSTGQKKRAAIAGVLAMKPEIIILDEPMANLDPRTASKVLQLLLELNKRLGLTLIIATHDVDLVPLFANEICILNKGQIVTAGTPTGSICANRAYPKHGLATCQE